MTSQGEHLRNTEVQGKTADPDTCGPDPPSASRLGAVDELHAVDDYVEEENQLDCDPEGKRVELHVPPPSTMRSKLDSDCARLRFTFPSCACPRTDARHRT